MHFGDWEVHIVSSPWSRSNRIYLVKNDNHGGLALLANGILKRLTEGESSEKDYFAEMTDEQLQAFADALADKGIKTVKDSKNEGLLEATRYHLEDMRKIAMKGYK